VFGLSQGHESPRREPDVILAKDSRRIRAELALLDYEVAELTVAKYMHRTSPRPSPTWRAFLAAHARDIVAVDFFLVPTLTFRLLFAFVVLRHDRRELLHVSVTDHPSAVWTARQMIEAFPEETAPMYLLRDRDAIYGEAFTRCVHTMGIRQVITAPRAPWQNPFVERLIGSIRRECLDHFIILSEAHLTGTPMKMARRGARAPKTGAFGTPIAAKTRITAGADTGFPPRRCTSPGCGTSVIRPGESPCC
jgi:transposase InsO family protein